MKLNSSNKVVSNAKTQLRFDDMLIFSRLIKNASPL